MDAWNNDNLTERLDSLPAEPTDHPLYQEIEYLTNQGDWVGAQTPLAKLLQLYPDDPFLRELSKFTRTRSVLINPSSPETAQLEQSSGLGQGKKLALVGLGVVAVLALIVGGGIAFRSLVLPQMVSQQREARIRQLHQEAETTFASGDYNRAVLAYNELLQLQPGNPQALQGLEQTNQLRELVGIYSEAIAAMEAHRWDEALILLQQIETDQPGYRDVPARISFVQKQQMLSDQFNEAEVFFDQAHYEQAIPIYENLQSLDPNFQREIARDHLFFSYLQLALIEEEAAGADPVKLQTSLEKFDKALSLRPQDTQAKGESQLLRTYLSGLENLEAERWSQAISDFESVYEIRPDFGGNSVAQRLYDAYLAQGDELFEEQKAEQALVQYEAASFITRDDSSELDQRLAMAEAALAPTPTVTPTSLPTATSTPTQVAPASSSSGTTSAAAPRPTPTPQLLPYVLKTMNVRNNCDGFGYIHGIVRSPYDLPLSGVVVQTYNLTTGIGPLTANPTDANGIYQIILNGDQIDGLWMVQVIGQDGLPASQPWGQHMGGGCQTGVQELKVDWQFVLQP
jgi:tetratricopeptide (TPR) repeat protein